MPNLKPSLKGDNYSQEEKKEMWDEIHTRRKCPECGAIDSMLKGPRGGFALNIKCSKCKMIFWTTPFTGFGAYPVSSQAKKGG
ncbi:hypothetical protein ES703_96123 [subsurface metagenome]